MSSIISLPLPRQPRPPLNVGPLAYALSHMEPELRELVLPGESWDDMIARREAARDILDDLLAEAAEVEQARLTAAEDLLGLVDEELAQAQAIVDRLAALAEGVHPSEAVQG